MRLTITSLHKILFDGEANSITCATTSGEITVLDHHEPLITILSRGALKVLDNSKEERYIPVSTGLLEVRDNAVRLIVNE